MTEGPSWWGEIIGAVVLKGRAGGGKKKPTAVEGRSNLLNYQHHRQGVLVIGGHVISFDYAVGWPHNAATVQGRRSCLH